MDQIFDSVLGFTLILHAQVFFSIVAKENSDFDLASFVVLSWKKLEWVLFLY